MANYLIKKNNIITIVRGDSFSVDISISDLSSGKYSLAESDVLYFALMYPNSHFEDAILIKKYTTEDLNSDETVTIYLEPEDTELLSPGTYYYTIKLNVINGGTEEVHTLIPKTKFNLID